MKKILEKKIFIFARKHKKLVDYNFLMIKNLHTVYLLKNKIKKKLNAKMVEIQGKKIIFIFRINCLQLWGK